MEYAKTIYSGADVAALASSDQFVARVHEATASGFRRPDFDYEDTRYHLQADYLAIAHHGDSTVAGFLSGKFGTAGDMLPGVDLGEAAEQKVAYLFGTAVHADYQGNGVYVDLATDFITEAQARGHSRVLFSTQNPHVEAGFDKALEGLGQEAEKVRIPIPGRYGRLLTGEVPSLAQNADVQRVYEGLRRDAGDAFAVMYTLGQTTKRERRSPF